MSVQLHCGHQFFLLSLSATSCTGNQVLYHATVSSTEATKFFASCNNRLYCGHNALFMTLPNTSFCFIPLSATSWPPGYALKPHSVVLWPPRFG